MFSVSSVKLRTFRWLLCGHILCFSLSEHRRQCISYMSEESKVEYNLTYFKHTILQQSVSRSRFHHPLFLHLFVRMDLPIMPCRMRRFETIYFPFWISWAHKTMSLFCLLILHGFILKPGPSSQPVPSPFISLYEIMDTDCTWLRCRSKQSSARTLFIFRGRPRQVPTSSSKSFELWVHLRILVVSG